MFLAVTGSSYCLNFDKCRDVLFKKRAGVYSRGEAKSF